MLLFYCAQLTNWEDNVMTANIFSSLIFPDVVEEKTVAKEEMSAAWGSLDFGLGMLFQGRRVCEASAKFAADVLGIKNKQKSPLVAVIDLMAQ
ncbi:MAG: hypothetical protein UR51_C0027G0007 [Candidatus Moranbacteria bacterium GW2011_GWF1_34_10]|nr:MAG: hypothetical protein UR51_C0027G0007 [Candidatus Moranbacteria bacterium GW2011_GWF1_34_10]